MRTVTLVNDKVKVIPCDDDLDKLKISEYGRLYVGLAPNTNDLYLLHGVLIKNKWEYRWLALWNVTTYTSIENILGWDTIESAISYALKYGWSVRQLNNDYFKYLIESMKYVP